jgi:uncharacterized membrane protein YgcG
VLRFDAAARAVGLRAAVLSLSALLALSQGCARTADAPAAGEASARKDSRPLVAQASPAPPAQPAPARDGAAEGSPLPQPEGFVNDFADVIDEGAEAALEVRLRRLQERSKIELAVATVETTGGRSIYDYSLAVARAWGVGPPAGEEGGGVLLLLATADRKWRIQVSRGLEADLPDEVVGQIGSRMAPALRESRYADALDACVDALVQRLAERRGFPAKEDNPVPQPSPAAKPAQRPNAGDRRKFEPRGKP